MPVADIERVFAVREEAHKLALRHNGDKLGIIADDDAPGCMLERMIAAAPEEMPLWGQSGDFIVKALALAAVSYGQLLAQMEGELPPAAARLRHPRQLLNSRNLI